MEWQTPDWTHQIQIESRSPHLLFTSMIQSTILQLSIAFPNPKPNTTLQRFNYCSLEIQTSNPNRIPSISYQSEYCSSMVCLQDRNRITLKIGDRIRFSNHSHTLIFFVLWTECRMCVTPSNYSKLMEI